MTDSRKYNEYKMNYARDVYKRVPLDLKKDKYEDVKRAAESVGESVNGYIKSAIDRRLQSGD